MMTAALRHPALLVLSQRGPLDLSAVYLTKRVWEDGQLRTEAYNRHYAFLRLLTPDEYAWLHANATVISEWAAYTGGRSDHPGDALWWDANRGAGPPGPRRREGGLMANWRYHLNLKDLWERYEDEKLTVQQVAAGVADRLDQLKMSPLLGIGLERLVEEFRALSQEDDAAERDFNSLMTDLYDWADEWPVWVTTF